MFVGIYGTQPTEDSLNLFLENFKKIFGKDLVGEKIERAARKFYAKSTAIKIELQNLQEYKVFLGEARGFAVEQDITRLEEMFPKPTYDNPVPDKEQIRGEKILKQAEGEVVEPQAAEKIEEASKGEDVEPQAAEESEEADDAAVQVGQVEGAQEGEDQGGGASGSGGGGAAFQWSLAL